MPAFTVPFDGLKLSAVPRPNESHKRDRFAQAVVVQLPESFRVNTIEEADGEKVLASLAGSNPYISIGGGKRTTLSLDLHANGYLYRCEDGTDGITLKARLDLKVPDKPAPVDAEFLELMQGIENAKAEKRSAATADLGFTGNTRDGKRLKLDATSHRRGLFGGADASRSATGSPNLPPKINVPSEDPVKKAKQDAIRISLVHLVAIRDVSKDYIVKTLRCSLSEVETLLNRHCAPGLNPSKYKLNQKAFKLLDPYSFNYSEEDRKIVIDKAVETFDRLRLGPEEKEWQRLLPKDERGKGMCLSKLEKQKLERELEFEKQMLESSKPRTTDEQRANLDTTLERTLSGSRPPSPVSRPGSSGSAHSRYESRNNKDSTSSGLHTLDRKRLEIAAKEEKKEAKARETAIQKALAEGKASTNAGTAPSSASKARVTGPAKTTAKKSTERKGAAVTQPASGKIKSAEFITESDDEEAEAATKVGDVSPRPSETAQTNKAPVKAASKPAAPAVQKSAPAVTSFGRAAEKQSSKSSVATATKHTDSPTIKVTTVPTPSSSLSRPNARPSALDKSKLAAKPVITPSASSRPSTPTSASMPFGGAPKVLQTKKILVPASTSTPRMAASRAAAASSAKSSPKEGVKSATSDKTAKVADKAQASSAASPREVSRKPTPKRDPDAPPKRFEPEKQTEPTKKPVNGEVKAKAAATRPASSATNTKVDRSATAVQSRTAVSKTSSKPTETLRAPAMQKTGSHQRKSSSPIKPSPLASSPPISASDMEEMRSTKTSAASTPLKRPASNIAQRPVIKSAKREPAPSHPTPRSSGETNTQLKRKANNVDSSSTSRDAAASGAFERPAKRRETGAGAPYSTGASGSTTNKPAASGGLKAKADYERADSHSPSPASSTIGSTSTKGTTTSMLYGGSSADNGKGKQTAHDGGKDDDMIFGYDRATLEKAAKLEDDTARYSAKLKELMDMPESERPLSRIKEMGDWYAKLERQRRVYEAVKQSAL